MTKSLVSAAKMIGGAAVAGAIVKAFVQISKESEKLAISAEEIEGKFNVVFRNVSDAANDMASRLGDDFDLTSSTVQELLGNTGDLVTGFGLTQDAALKVSDATNRLALDLASFTNAQGGAAAVSKALTSAYSGERESLKTYGIVISEADVKARMLLDAQKGLTFENERAAKINATLSLATEQSKNAIGDYARTAESGANIQRTLNEQLKRSKEIWGETVTEGVTPLRKAFRDYLKDLNDVIEVEKNIGKAFAGTQETTVKELEAQQKLVNELAADYAKIGGDAARDFSTITEELDRQKEILEKLKSNLRVQAQINLEKERENDINEGLIKQRKLAAEEQDRLDKLSLEAFAQIEKKRFSALDAEEKQLELIDKAIDKWSEYKDIAGAQELLNVLLKEEEAILRDSIDGYERKNTKIIEAFALSAELQAQLDIYKEEYQTQLDQNAAMEEYNRLLQETKISAMDLAEVGLGAMLRGFEEVGKAIVEGGLSFKTFGKLALTTLADVLSSMGAQLAAQAALLFFGLIPDVGRGAGALAASAAAYTGAGVARAAAGSFEDGGIVPGTSYTGDNMLANVNSGEMVLNKGQQQNLFNQLQGGGSGMNNSRFTLVLDNGTELFGSIQQEFDNGGLRVPQRNVV